MIDGVLTNKERHALRQQIAESRRLLACLAAYEPEIQQPCKCGCLLFAPAGSGYRCLRCMPPLDLSEAMQAKIAATLPG